MHLAVAWYEPTQWLRLKEISEDGDRLEETYGEWQLLAEKAMKDLAAAGVIPEKVAVDVKELLIWCNERNLLVNGESRSKYAAWLMKERDSKGELKS